MINHDGWDQLEILYFLISVTIMVIMTVIVINITAIMITRRKSCVEPEGSCV